MTSSGWPDTLPAVQVRMARPTERLDEIVAFYVEVLGLPQLQRSHDGTWTVVMVGLPGEQYHLEFVAHAEGIDGTAPTAENLLVFYFESEAEMHAVRDRLREAGAPPTELDNPWWDEHGALAFLDPDGWRIVLMPQRIGFASESS